MTTPRRINARLVGRALYINGIEPVPVWVPEGVTVQNLANNLRGLAVRCVTRGPHHAELAGVCAAILRAEGFHVTTLDMSNEHHTVLGVTLG